MLLYYRFRLCGRRRYKKEMKELMSRRSEARPVRAACYVEGRTALDRMALADLAEEEGLDYLAMFLRTMMTETRPAWSRKK